MSSKEILLDAWGDLSAEVREAAASELSIHLSRGQKFGTVPIETNGAPPLEAALACAKLMADRRNYRLAANFCIELARNRVRSLDLLQFLVKMIRTTNDKAVIEDGVSALVDAAEENRKWASILVCNFKQLRFHINPATLHETMWGFDLLETRNLNEALERVSLSLDPRSQESSRFKKSRVLSAYAATARSETFEQFENHLHDYYFRNSYVSFLFFYQNSLRQQPAYDEQRGERIRLFLDQLEELVVFRKPEVLDATKSSDRSIIIAYAHGGLDAFSRFEQLKIKLPHTKIARGVQPTDWKNVDKKKFINISSVGPNVSKDFAKLIKLMRKRPRIISVFPDGLDGTGRVETLLGRQVNIGIGAAALAYHGRGDIYFFKTDWKDGTVDVELVPLCSVEHQENYETCENKFVSEYLACLEDIVTGHPRRMGVMASGFWGGFDTPSRSE